MCQLSQIEQGQQGIRAKTDSRDLGNALNSRISHGISCAEPAGMATITSTDTPTSTARYAELKGMLEDRRRAATSNIQDTIRQAQERIAAGTEARVGLDDIELAEVDVQDDIAAALMQMKAELLRHIDEALNRLRDGQYGLCIDCGVEISEKRLRALPFAVRCTSCEELREADHERRRRSVARGDDRRELPVGSPVL